MTNISKIKWMQREAVTDGIVLDEKDILSVLTDNAAPTVSDEIQDYIIDLQDTWEND